MILMASSGSATAEFQLTQPGEYTLRFMAAGDQAGPDPVRVAIKINGKDTQQIDVKATRDGPETYKVKLKLPGAATRVAAHFINDYYQPKAPDPKLRGDRNFYLYWMELEGPAGAYDKPLPASHRQLIIAHPNDRSSDDGPQGKKIGVRDAALQCLRPLVQRAFRRQASDAEVAPFVKLVESATTRDESFERGMQVALTGLLVSPQFLFRVERDTHPDDAKQSHELSQYELANRLSYFLWSSMPDDRLFQLAGQGKLANEQTLLAEARRMLQDPRASQLGEHFAGQWLNLRNLDEAAPDPKQFGAFNAQLRDDMKHETLMFFNTVVRENRSVLDFVQGDFTFLNERLAKHYKVPNVKGGDKFRRVSLRDRRKLGVLGHASILTLTSNPTRTSPVKRGKWIMENILGTPPPTPPADVPELEATKASAPNATLREQLELHRNTPSCAVCHRQMDALGFGLQNFDAIGRWRELESGKPVDSTGELPGGAKFDGPQQLGKVLAGKQDQICRNLCEKMLTYALGRGLQYYDRCAVDQIVARLEANDYRFNQLVEGIVLSDPFRKRRGEKQ